MAQLPQDLSPLELLEQRSRRLATRLHDAPKDVSSQTTSQPNAQGKDFKDSSFQSQSDSQNVDTDIDPDIVPSRFTTRASRTNSTNSLASLGSILGSFRLSTFSIINSDSDNASIRSGRDSIYAYDSERVPSGMNNSIPPSQQSRARSYSRQYEGSSHFRSDSASMASGTPKSPQIPPSHPNERLTPSISRDRDRYSGISSSSQRSSGDKKRVSSLPKVSSFHSPGISSSITPNSPHLSSSHSMSSPAIKSSIATSESTNSLNPQDISKYQANRYSDSHVRAFDTSESSSKELPSLNRTTSLSNFVAPSNHRPYSQDTNHLSSSHLRTTSQSSTSSKSTLTDTKKQAGSLSNNNDSFEALRLKSLNNSLTLEEHVSLGIIYHENGNLRESSYHWQHASFHGDLTGMLLYGLALRHGWGIRQNPAEAVKWLRKAIGPTIDTHSLDDVLRNDVTQDLQDILSKDIFEQKPVAGSGKVKKAQIALALYELGMCYLNSWGIEKDEDLALRCFELAGGMGDMDALCEAASLWMKNGPKGRKKNLQRAAKLYRTAGEKGASMVSNSWIYKDKYMVGEDGKKGDKKKKK